MNRISFLVLAVIVVLTGCSNDESQIKTRLYEQFSTSGELVDSFAYGFDREGNQTFFVGLKGYNAKDTSWFDAKYRYEVESDDEFVYQNDTLIAVKTTKSDTVMIYDADFPDQAYSFYIEDSKGLKYEGEYRLNKLHEYNNRVFDDHGNMISADVKQSYLPDSEDLEYLSEGELLVQKGKHRKDFSIKITLTYY